MGCFSGVNVTSLLKEKRTLCMKYYLHGCDEYKIKCVKIFQLTTLQSNDGQIKEVLKQADSKFPAWFKQTTSRLFQLADEVNPGRVLNHIPGF